LPLPDVGPGILECEAWPFLELRQLLEKPEGYPVHAFYFFDQVRGERGSS